jgi:RNA polymerase sigma factor (sigma-70 family)
MILWKVGPTLEPQVGLEFLRLSPWGAEDVLQEAYRKILEGRARYDGRSAFKTWLFVVIRNTAAGERRRRWIRLLRLGSYQNERANDQLEPDRCGALDDASRLSIFRQILSALPRRQQEVLHLVFYQNMTVEAAAQAMSVSVGSARTHYDRAKKRMAELLRQTKLFP